MKLTLYQIDAFTNKLFGGNPAAVIPLKKWLSAELMQQLALENNLSETVFFVPSEKNGVDYDIRCLCNIYYSQEEEEVDHF